MINEMVYDCFIRVSIMQPASLHNELTVLLESIDLFSIELKICWFCLIFVYYHNVIVIPCIMLKLFQYTPIITAAFTYQTKLVSMFIYM